MTTQEAYEQIREYFTRYGAEIAREGAFATCQYRTPTGQKCAVGCLIPDEKYEDGMEGEILCADWLGAYPFMEGLLYGVDRGFLRAAQMLHDGVARDASSFVTGLDLIAKLYGLRARGIPATDTFVKPLV